MTIALTVLGRDRFPAWVKRQPARVRRWLEAAGFVPEPEAGAAILIPEEDGSIKRAVACLGENAGPWDWAAIAARLPAGIYHLDGPVAPDSETAALGWRLAAYRFGRYKTSAGKPLAELAWPAGCDRDAVLRLEGAIILVRDLINTPAEDMGPGDLAGAARNLARRHKARLSVIEGEALLTGNYPAIHAVGRGAVRQPALIDLRWGPETAPRVTLVGKGVCFDSGGYDLKTAEGMRLMKKDMGGAAHVLGLASLVMGAKLKVRLRVLIPAVENMVSGNALRPGDVVRTRKGPTVEIGNTDAEGRVILADALAEAAREQPELLVDFATLTGAARIALGTDIPALFCNDDSLAGDLLACSAAEGDPLWRLPLWPGYAKQVESKVADLTNNPDGSYGGAITAALFLQRFVGPGIPWVHLDLMAWNTSARPGRPEGGEAQALRALFALLETKFGDGRN
ncbi:MAG: leucyl aminopeptidase family protein [Magnetospirillum sp. WYHS-4]